MSWFFLALIASLGWGLADLFYKKGTDEDDSDSHLKIAVWVGLVMGLCSLAVMPLSESKLGFGDLPGLFVRYSPASLCYILSMVIGYAGLRYLELSIASPVQNASGALSFAVMAVWFTAKGRFTSIFDEFSPLDLIGTLFIVTGVIALAFAEQRVSSDAKDASLTDGDRKYRFGALALLFPLLYCVFDTLGTAADGILLDEETGLGLGEIDVLVVYGLTFAAAGLLAWLYMLVRRRKCYNPFTRREAPKGLAALCEEFGQVFYVFAMADNPMMAAPMIASYCIVSVLLSRIFLKEKLNPARAFCVGIVIAGIVLLGISEGLAEVG